VLHDCVALRCAASDPDLKGFQTEIQRLIAVRQETDAALDQPLGGRPPGLIARWDKEISNAVSTLDRLSTTLTERVRLADAPIAELIAVKQLGWLVRDSARKPVNVSSDRHDTQRIAARHPGPAAK
jgi:hypothetical protein